MAIQDAPDDSPGLNPDDAERARLVSRLSTEYVLRSLSLTASLFGGDMIMAIVASAIVEANTAHLNANPDHPARYASLDDTPPDEERRPVSVLAISGTLGLPFETTRRYVNKLIERGHCRRLPGGIICLRAGLASAENQAAIVANIGNLRRLLKGLSQAGLTAEG